MVLDNILIFLSIVFLVLSFYKYIADEDIDDATYLGILAVFSFLCAIL